MSDDTITTPDFSQAQGAALARLESASSLGGPDAPPPEPAPEPQAPPEPAAPAPAPGEPQPQATQPVAWEGDIDGRRVRLTGEDVAWAMKDLYRRILAEREAQVAQPQARAEAPHPPTEGTRAGTPERFIQDLTNRVAQLEGEAQRVEGERLRQSILTAAETAVNANAFLKNLDPDFRSSVMGMVMHRQWANPSMSYETAASDIAKVIEGHLKKSQELWVKSKIQQGKQKVDGSGTASVPTKKPSGADIQNGTAMRRAQDRIERMLQAG